MLAHRIPTFQVGITGEVARCPLPYDLGWRRPFKTRPAPADPELIRMFELDPSLLNDVLPVGVMVIDDLGVLRYANQRIGELTGVPAADMVGRSVAEFIAPDDLNFLAASLISGTEFTGITGPVRMRYLDATGRTQWTEYWAFRAPEVLGFDGFVVTVSSESTLDNLSNAVHGIARDEDLDESLATVARALAGHPLTAVGAILIDDPDEGVHHVGEWPFADERHLRDPAAPWASAGADQPRSIAIDDLPESVRDDAAALGFRSVWVRPVNLRGSLYAIVVAWRREPQDTSPNQQRHLDEVVSVAQLALEHHENLRRLQDAALRDPLTQLGNRSRLVERFEATADETVVILFMDLDDFKPVNTNHGHLAGDHVLQVVGQRITGALRGDDEVFRVGGDEFVVLVTISPDGDGRLPNARDVGAKVAQRALGALRAPLRVDGHELQVSASAGYAVRAPEEPLDSVLDRADRALLIAKRIGKGHAVEANNWPPPSAG
jgi:diguanylate cyclase (GGDEF)-like protein/PAS domain S-box-containing protein